MVLLIDENVPQSVADFFVERGHDVRFVRDLLAAGSADPVVALIGDRLSAIVVTWDRDFDKLVSRVPSGNQGRFRKLGRITFSCNEVNGRKRLADWIDHIELHYAKAQSNPDIRMIVQIQESAVKFF
jgi:predicted nuclease of predicted toxin-antitoxin system